MKKLLAVAALVGLVLAFQPMEQAEADPPVNCSQFCKSFPDLGPLNHGQCTSMCTACTRHDQGAEAADCVCKFLMNFPGLPYKNYGQCIKALK